MSTIIFAVPGFACLIFIIADLVISERRRRRAFRDFFSPPPPNEPRHAR